MRIAVLAAIVAIFGISGCAQPPPPKMVWVRVDGKRMQGDPVLAQQFEVDRTVCVGGTGSARLAALNPIEPEGANFNRSIARQRDAAAGDVMRGCMADKGYLFVREDEAEARSAELATIDAQKRARENPPPPATAKRTVTSSR